MSDEEEEVDSEQEEEEEEDDDDEDEEEEGEDKEDEELILKRQAEKQKFIQEDIATIRDIFQYIDRTSVRMIKMRQMEESIQRQGNQQNFNGGYPLPPMAPSGNAPVAWSNYENLTDIERAELLERALSVLADDPR